MRGSSNPRGSPLYRGDTACASAAGWLLLWSDIRTGEMRNYQCRVRNGCESLELGMHAEEAGAVQSCLKKAEKTALMFLMVTAGRLNDTSILFLPVYPFPFSSFTWGRGKKTFHQVPPPPLFAMLFIGLRALILVKGEFCNVWLLNLISLPLIPHSVIRLMACVLSASPFTCACSSFIESSRSLNRGRSRASFGSSVQPLFPPPTSRKQKEKYE